MSAISTQVFGNEIYINLAAPSLAPKSIDAMMKEYDRLCGLPGHRSGMIVNRAGCRAKLVQTKGWGCLMVRKGG